MYIKTVQSDTEIGLRLQLVRCALRIFLSRISELRSYGDAEIKDRSDVS
jgi:hypothetical protein